MAEPSSPTDRGAGRLTAIFAKLPAPGRVKTRLCPPLSAEQAAAFAEATLADAVARCLTVRTFRTRLVFAPPEGRSWFRERFPELEALEPQRGRGLAERLASFFVGVLREPDVATAVAIGSDSPTVPLRRIDEAHDRLEAGADVVLGPDRGGGYYLVGMGRPHPELFTAVEMSTDTMLDDTLELARQRGLEVELLERGYDVDVAADLERLRAEVAAMETSDPDYPRATARALAELFAG